MPSFGVRGSDVLRNGSVATNSSGGSNGQGEIRVNGGQQPFEADDFILFEVTSTTAQGEIGPGSAISDVTVFDTYADYVAWRNSGGTLTARIKYNYRPMNPGQTATIQSDISGLGDTYVRFNSNIFVPENGGPSLGGNVLVAPGSNVGDRANRPLRIDRVQNLDINLDGSIGGGVEPGNGRFFVGDYEQIIYGAPICFTAGTRVWTARGARSVETLRKGDLVRIVGEGLRPLRWIGQTTVRAQGGFAPVRIADGVLGNRAAIEVSPNHRLLVASGRNEMLFGDRETLVAAKFLLGRPGVSQRRGGTVTYVHLMFDTHCLINTYGLISESLVPTANPDRALRGDVSALFASPAQALVAPARRILTAREAAVALAG